jgi:hypothetical protein
MLLLHLSDGPIWLCTSWWCFSEWPGLLSPEFELASQYMSDLLELQGPLLETTLPALSSISSAKTHWIHCARLTDFLASWVDMPLLHVLLESSTVRCIEVLSCLWLQTFWFLWSVTPSSRHNLPLQNSVLFFGCQHSFAVWTALSLDSVEPFWCSLQPQAEYLDRTPAFHRVGPNATEFCNSSHKVLGMMTSSNWPNNYCCRRILHMIASCPNLTCLAMHKPSTCLQGSGWFSQSDHLSVDDKLNWTSNVYPKLHVAIARNEKWIGCLCRILSSLERHASIQPKTYIVLPTLHFYRWSWLVWNGPPLLNGPLLPRWSRNQHECEADQL